MLTLAVVVAAIALLLVLAYAVYPALCRRSVADGEGKVALPGDDIVPRPDVHYTLAISIAAPPSEVFPWLVQMGQGRAGFYTHTWIENLLLADVHNANRIVPELQRISIGDFVRLTPDPYLGRPPQTLVVARLKPPSVLVFGQRLPRGGIGSWAYVLRRAKDGTTRLLFRRRSDRSSILDRLLLPAYLFMDRGMLHGVKRRAERHRPLAAPTHAPA